MQTINKLSLIYFSATSTTKKTLQYIAEGTGLETIVHYDITLGQVEEIVFGKGEMAVLGVPVYSGRIPQVVVEYLKKFRGNNTPALIVCVFGNRDFDDALIELKNIVEANHFRVISAAAFVAQHSIFPQVGENRPDTKDKEISMDFGRESLEKLQLLEDIETIPRITVKGNYPYREIKSIPLKPKGNRRCDFCGKCVRGCPVQAIDIKNPRKTDKDRCISCGRCIYTCPQQARNFGGLLYKMVSKKFTKANKARKEPYIVFAI